MKGMLTLVLMAMLAGAAPAPALAAETMKETFDNRPETRWRFFADTVMGGVSTGGMAFGTQENKAFARLSGSVSTRNNGGFIQMRRDLPGPPPEGTRGVRLVARGNDQRYFVHLRTSGTMLPWQYYQSGFEVTGQWMEIRLPLESFRASGKLLRRTPKPGTITSYAIVAYGRDHEAEIDVMEIGFY